MSLLGKCLKLRVYQGKELNEVMSGGKMRNDPKAATNKWGRALSYYFPFHSLLIP